MFDNLDKYCAKIKIEVFYEAVSYIHCILMLGYSTPTYNYKKQKKNRSIYVMCNAKSLKTH